MKLKVWLIVGFIIVVAVVFIGVKVQKHRIKTNPVKARRSHAAIPVMTDTVKVKTIEEIIGASGVVEPISFVQLTAMVESRVESVNVDIGDIVKPQQILVTFDSKVYKAALLSAQSLFEKTETELENAKNNFERISVLYKKKMISKTELENAQNTLKTAQSNYASALESLANDEKNVEYTIIKSPVSGIINERSANPGETPQIHSKLLTIGNIDPIAFKPQVAEEKISGIRTGQKAEVVFDAFLNKTFTGEIVKIDPTVDPTTRTFSVFIKMPNHELQLKPGLSGFARINNRRTVLAIPSVAIINPVKDKATVFVIDAHSIAHIREIKTGMVTEGFTEVVSGLTEGQGVVTVGQINLRDGDTVRIGEEWSKGKTGESK